MPNRIGAGSTPPRPGHADRDLVTIWLYPMSAGRWTSIDALTPLRFAHDAIVVKLELPQEA